MVYPVGRRAAGIEGKDSCGKRAVRKSLYSFRRTARWDIMADMRADFPSYLDHIGVEPSAEDRAWPLLGARHGVR